LIPITIALVLSVTVVLSLRSEDDSNVEMEGGATVEEVVDGDTIRLEDGRRVRLVQIDTPELSEAECYSQQARGELERLLPAGSAVSLRRDDKLGDEDRFGRQLRYVFRGDSNVNLQLVRRGAASVWFVGGDRGGYAPRLLDAAKQARRSRRGLWRACPGASLDTSRGVDTGG